MDNKSLSREAEKELFRLYHETGDSRYIDELVRYHKGYVYHYANKFTNYSGTDYNDLVQCGFEGFMKAVHKYDPDNEADARFLTYATHWMKAAIFDHIIANHKVMKVATTHGQRKLFFNIRRLKGDQNDWLTVDQKHEIAETLDVPFDEVSDMEERLYKYNVGFDDPVSSDGENEFTHGDMIDSGEDENPAHKFFVDQQNAELMEHVANVIETLDEREQDIIKTRWLSDETTSLRVLGERYDISVERVRQLEFKAFRRIKNTMLHGEAA